MTKLCKKCGWPKSTELFAKKKRAADGLQTYCKVCMAQLQAEWKLSNKAKVTEYWLLKTYNLRLADYNKWLAFQNYGCGICMEKVSDSRQYALSVDHNKKCCPGKTSCGKCIRGLLCSKCNRGIGLFNDDIELLRTAISYVEIDGKWETQ